MRQREGLRVRVAKDKHGWIPQAREKATLTKVGRRYWLLGGMSYETFKDVSCCEFVLGKLVWQKVPFKGDVVPRHSHSTVQYGQSLFVFGGCFQFDRVRQVRECTGQLVEYNLSELRVRIVKTTGISNALKHHSAVMFKDSMLVVGGQTESNQFDSCFKVLQMDTLEWIQLPGFAVIQGSICAVDNTKQRG